MTKHITILGHKLTRAHKGAYAGEFAGIQLDVFKPVIGRGWRFQATSDHVSVTSFAESRTAKMAAKTGEKALRRALSELTELVNANKRSRK